MRSKVIQHKQRINFVLITLTLFKASFITWFCSVSLIWQLYHLIFSKYLWGVKFISMNRGIIWPNIILILSLDLDQWRDLWHHLLLFTLILPIHCLFEQLNIISMKCLFWLKLCNMISRIFWTNTFLIPSLVFYLLMSFVTSFCYISFNFNLIFRKWLSWK